MQSTCSPAAGGLRLDTVFGPEHGLLGEAQDLIGVGDDRTRSPACGPSASTASTVESLRPTAEQLDGLDVLVIDLQDVGSRYYTFPTTMLYCLEAAAKVGLRVRRPRPAESARRRGRRRPDATARLRELRRRSSDRHRHGLTIGELARLYKAERRIDVELEVIACEGWRRDMDWDATGLPWVLPSPNMPTVDTAFVYPGQCLIEGTNLSEGRGTTRPFELCGGPRCRRPPRLSPAAMVTACPASISGRRGSSRRSRSTPASAAAACNCTSPTARPSDRCAPAWRSWRLARGLRRAFAWRTEEYEFVSDPIAIDLLFGSDRERLALEAGHDLARHRQRVGVRRRPSSASRRRPYLLY